MNKPTEKLCSWNDDVAKGMSKSVRGYLLENPTCKNGQEYEGYCMAHLPYQTRLKYEYEQTTEEQRQQYLDLINSGSTIGDAHREAGISFDAALAITNKAIKAVHFLEKDATKL